MASDVKVNNSITIGTRWSKLALWQAHYIKQLLEEKYPGINISLIEITTKGDRNLNDPLPSIGGKGLFTAELEAALAEGVIDLAVHSLKDLPTEMADEFILGAIPERGSPYDVLVTADKKKLQDLPHGAIIGSSSLRRASQLKRLRSDLQFESIRGNVDTRIDKLTREGSRYAGVVLAEAGICRIGRSDAITQIFSAQEILPAPGQGALGVQCRRSDARTRELLMPINCSTTHACVTAERAFLAALGAGCSTPIGALCESRDSVLYFQGRCLTPEGDVCVEVGGTDTHAQAEDLGRKMALNALDQGFVITPLAT